MIFDKDEALSILSEFPVLKKHLRPYIGAREFINGLIRYIFYLEGISPSLRKSNPIIIDILKNVRKYRLASSRKATQELAEFPAQFAFKNIPDSNFLVLPKVSSARRPYMPVGWLSTPTIPSDLIHIVPDATLCDFSIITSTNHMAWLRAFGGRLKSDYRHTIGVVYNTYPWPDLDDKAKAKLTQTGQAILDARAA
jgi:hypothetical protein